MRNTDNIEEIYKQNFQIVYKYLYCLTHETHISEDLTQETFCKAINKIDTYRGTCKMSVWLCQIAKNLWLNELKKNKKISPIDEEVIDTKYNTEEDFIENEDKLLIYKQIQKLEEQTREVMYLRLTGELSFKEIGEILKKNEVWARVTFYRGKQQLKLKEGDYNETVQ